MRCSIAAGGRRGGYSRQRPSAPRSSADFTNASCSDHPAQLADWHLQCGENFSTRFSSTARCLCTHARIANRVCARSRVGRELKEPHRARAACPLLPRAHRHVCIDKREWRICGFRAGVGTTHLRRESKWASAERINVILYNNTPHSYHTHTTAVNEVVKCVSRVL